MIEGTITILTAFHGEHCWQFSIADDHLLVCYNFDNKKIEVVAEGPHIKKFFNNYELQVLCGSKPKGGVDGVVVRYQIRDSLKLYEASIWSPKKKHGSYFDIIAILLKVGVEYCVELQEHIQNISAYIPGIDANGTN
ncbi:hypothetical protein [Candidatus Uabimicrobium sp. HlEnr_7]|uniref:hypothetical protein n=1 Tax=Candidatus Uabimicrobium helgolandensis TaxID=3095367 RepID=UPI0035589E8E